MGQSYQIVIKEAWESVVLALGTRCTVEISASPHNSPSISSHPFLRRVFLDEKFLIPKILELF
jgi:hypothetical protein